MFSALHLRLACGLRWRAVLGLAVGTIGCRRRDRWAEWSWPLHLSGATFKDAIAIRLL